MLRASLRGLYSTEKITQALAEVHLDVLSRPEKLSLDQWIAFFERIKDERVKGEG